MAYRKVILAEAQQKYRDIARHIALTLDEFGELGRILHASYGNAH